MGRKRNERKYDGLKSNQILKENMKEHHFPTDEEEKNIEETRRLREQKRIYNARPERTINLSKAERKGKTPEEIQQLRKMKLIQNHH